MSSPTQRRSQTYLICDLRHKLVSLAKDTHDHVRTNFILAYVCDKAYYFANKSLISACGTRPSRPAKLPSDFNVCAALINPVHAARASAPPTLMRRTPSSAMSLTP